MIELLFKSAVLVVAVVILIAIWRSRADALMRIRQAKNYALASMACLIVGTSIDVVSIASLLNRLISPDARQDAAVWASAFSASGLILALMVVWRWLEAGKKLSWIADHEVETSGALHTELNERGLALSTVPAIIYRVSGNFSTPESMRVEFMNDKIDEVLGYSLLEVEKTSGNFQSMMHPDDRDRYFASEYAAVFESEQSVLEHRFRHKDGGYRWIRRHIRRVDDAEGNVKEFIGCWFDVTDLKDAEARLRSFLDFAPDAVVTVDENCEIAMASQLAAHSFRQSDGGLLGRHAEVLFSNESRQAGAQRISDELDGHEAGKERGNLELVCQRSDGTTFPAEIKLSAIDAGDHRLVAIAFRDISDRKETEAQLHQAQKMEAVGQLTGGIAHDFNNMLTVIAGNMQMIDHAGLSAEDRDHVRASTNAVERAAELTRRLLAFSRQQLLQPKVLNVNDLVVDMESMLQRTIGETITLQTSLDSDLWHTKIDRSQLENALMNLSINARDALQSGGHLSIATSNVVVEKESGEGSPDVPPGEYIRLAVQDSGSGIAAESLSRVFEPFYTTKESGKGSGLGLSMVYGFVTQSHGYIKVASEAGAGTTFLLYLPRSVDLASGDNMPAASDDAAPPGSERILVVEDNDSVRQIVCVLLKSLNYDVIDASSGPEALDIMRRDEDFDLLFTDMMMPGGITGAELATRMRASRPGLKVLYTSGQSGVLSKNDRLPDGATFLQKPYVKETLAQTVREALDG